MTLTSNCLERSGHGKATSVLLLIMSVKKPHYSIESPCGKVDNRRLLPNATRERSNAPSVSHPLYVLLKHQTCVFDLHLCRCECTAYTSSPLIGGAYKSLAWTSATCFSRLPNHTSPRAYNNTLLLPLQRWTMVCIYWLLSAHFKPFHLCRRRCQLLPSMPTISLVQSHLGARFAERLPSFSGL